MDSPRPLIERYDDISAELTRTTPTRKRLEELELELTRLDQLLLAAPEHERGELENRSRAAHGHLGRAWEELEHPLVISPQPSALANYRGGNALSRDHTERDGFDR